MKMPPRIYGRSTRESADKVRSAAHRKWVRSHACILHDRNECEGPIDCAHVKTGNSYSNRSKAGDQFTVSMCRFHHDMQTRMGEARFQIALNVDMRTWAEKFAKESPIINPKPPATKEK